MKREPYTYTLLRYRHDPVAGEQINVGVAIYAPRSGFLGALFRKAYGRITKVFPDVNGSLLRQDLGQIERAFEKLSKRKETNDLLSDQCTALTFAHKIIGVDDSSLIWSTLGSGLTNDPAKTLEDLHHRFVSQYDEPHQQRRGDADIWRPFRDYLLERKIADIFQVKTIRSPRNEVEFQHAWKNGKWHCIQPLSFDLTTEDGIQEKAAKWVGHMVGLLKADEEFKPYFLIGRPSDESMLPAYQRALDFLSEAPLAPEIVQESEMDRLADTLADKVKASGVEP
ncbi:DUF3037 domain-containing protein [Rhizobium leguminosarum]|uniref:DUF3037 domain-containing protein n=1 Tax=Rhizobium leguminosarum TaxID=384 RepID=UPI0004108F02|nr:DUF3037 domain-containing protein [Rhizobium leguminosarum]